MGKVGLVIVAEKVERQHLRMEKMDASDRCASNRSVIAACGVIQRPSQPFWQRDFRVLRGGWVHGTGI